MKGRRAAWIVILGVLVTCSFTTMVVAQSPPIAPGRAGEKLVLLYSFETGSGLSPDDLVFSPAGGGRLVIVAANPSSLYEMTVRGELVAQYPGLGSNAITRSTRGPNMGHFFQANPGPQVLTIAEFDEHFTHIRDYTVDRTTFFNGVPGDALAFNHHRSTFLVSDLPANLIHEVACREDGTQGTFIRSFKPSGFSAPAGMTFDVSSGTYYGVLHIENALVQFDDMGTLIRWISLEEYGVQKPVGVTVGQGKIFIADELSDNRHDITGFIYVFKEPAPVR
jgi:hypothetical protein